MDDVIGPTAEYSLKHSSTQLTVLAFIKTIFIKIGRNIANPMAMASQEWNRRIAGKCRCVMAIGCAVHKLVWMKYT